MVIATSLALGLLLGLGVVQVLRFFWNGLLQITCGGNSTSNGPQDEGKKDTDSVAATEGAELHRKQDLQGVLNTVPEDDPDTDDDESSEGGNGNIIVETAPLVEEPASA